MDVMNPTELRALLSAHDIRPRKHWGQNFLVSKPILKRMLSVADVQPKDTVLEIGGGVGALTLPLTEQAKQVVVYERDPSLCKILKERLVELPNAQLRCEDARSCDFNNLPHDYRIIANLPYSVGLPILRSAFESDSPPKDAYVMLQREVGERLLGEPPKRTLAATAWQVLATIQKEFVIPAKATWPIPDVDSIYLSLKPRMDIPKESLPALLDTIKRGFKHPRKKVLRNLTDDNEQASALGKTCSIPGDARAGELTDAQWSCATIWLTEQK